MKGYVVSWFFPPVNSSEGLVTFKLLKNSKYKYDVFTQKNSISWTYGNKDTDLVSDNINSIFSNSEITSEWIEEGYKHFVENYKKYDFIMTRSMSPEAHIIGLKIKKEFPEVKWLASFGDPIGNNPYNDYIDEKNPYSFKKGGFENNSFKYNVSPKRIIKSLIWRIRKKRSYKYKELKKNINLEKNVIKNADLIICNNDYQRKYMTGKNCYTSDKKKFVVLPHSFDSSLYPKSKTKSNKFKITYLGHLDYIRNIDLFLKAIKRIVETQKTLLKNVEINFYGNMSTKNKENIIDYRLTKIINVLDSVTYNESLKIMKDSDLLLLFDANLGNILEENIFFPAKLVDYIGARTPIFAVTMLDGASADILRETNSSIATFSEDDIYNQLVYILKRKVLKSKDKVEKYDAKNVGETYDKIVEELIK